MSTGVYIHATSALLAILRSGFRGSSKAGSKLGEGAPTTDNKTFFVEWQTDKISASISRLKAPLSGDLRGILVLMDPAGNLMERPSEGAYPRIAGSTVDLRNLSLRALFFCEEDGTAAFGDAPYLDTRIGSLIRDIKGRVFEYFPEPFVNLQDADHVDACLREARDHGCFL